MKSKHKKCGPGRPAIYPNEKARLAARKQWNHEYQTSEAYKAHRSWRYANDPDYRAKCQARDRDAMLAKRQPIYDSYRALVTSNILEQRQSYYSIVDFSNLIDRSPEVVRRWIRAGLFPKPTATYKTPRNHIAYTRGQATLLAKLVVYHLKTPTAHLTRQRERAIAAFHSAVAA